MTFAPARLAASSALGAGTPAACRFDANSGVSSDTSSETGAQAESRVMLAWDGGWRGWAGQVRAVLIASKALPLCRAVGLGVRSEGPRRQAHRSRSDDQQGLCIRGMSAGAHLIAWALHHCRLYRGKLAGSVIKCAEGRTEGVCSLSQPVARLQASGDCDCQAYAWGRAPRGARALQMPCQVLPCAVADKDPRSDQRDGALRPLRIPWNQISECPRTLVSALGPAPAPPGVNRSAASDAWSAV